MKNPKIYYVHRVLPPYRAMTIPPFGIFISRQHKNNEKLFNHEMVHWKQYQKMGFFIFYVKYFFQLLTIGYDEMPMEMEARYEEDEYTKKYFSKVYHNSNKNIAEHGISGSKILRL